MVESNHCACIVAWLHHQITKAKDTRTRFIARSLHVLTLFTGGLSFANPWRASQDAPSTPVRQHAPQHHPAAPPSSSVAPSLSPMGLNEAVVRLLRALVRSGGAPEVARVAVEKCGEALSGVGGENASASGAFGLVRFCGGGVASCAQSPGPSL